MYKSMTVTEITFDTDVHWIPTNAIRTHCRKVGEVGMKLQVEIQDLRRMLKEKCEEIISDKKLAYEFYWRICEIEENDRFTIVDDELEGR